MSNLQVKNIPDELHARLRLHARKNGATVIAAIERELARNEWHERLATRPKTNIGIRASDTLAEERALRERELTL